MGHDAVQQLGAEIWQWRHAIAFHTGDDIPRVDRGADWVPQFSVAAIDDIRSRYAEFHARWAAIDVSSEPVPVQVDYRLVGSSLARVTWDIDTLRNWEKDAVFLTSQILGPFFDRLLQVPPFSAERQQALVTVAEAIPSPSSLKDGREGIPRGHREGLQADRQRLQDLLPQPRPCDSGARKEHRRRSATHKFTLRLNVWLRDQLPV